jgi:tetratricopeptide (TPR) repeat protein
MITGRLTMMDGLPPQEMIPVGLSCQTNPMESMMADLRGEFRIPLKLPYSRSSVPAMMQLNATCAITVNIPGFEVIRKNLHGIDVSRGADVGNLVLRPLSKIDATLVSLNSLKAPETARKELLRAREELRKENLGPAKDRLERAVKIYPDYATAWYELGRVQARQGAKDQAAESYRRAIEADPKYVSPAVELALMAAVALRWEEAEQRSGTILQVAPTGLPGIYLVHAIACFNQKKLDEAEQSARAGLKEDTSKKFPKLANLLGDILLKKGDKEGAALAFRQYLEMAPNSADASRVRVQLQSLEK